MSGRVHHGRFARGGTPLIIYPPQSEGGGGGGAVTHPLLPLNPLFLYAGGGTALSTFAQNSDGTSENTADGQVVGYVQDLTTNGVNATRTVTNNKPLFYANNGIKGFRGGLVSGQRRGLQVPINIGTSGFDLYIVEKRATTAGMYNVPIYLQTSGSGLGRILCAYNDTTLYMFEDNVGDVTATVSRSAAPIVSRFYRESGADGVTSLGFKQYTLDGTFVAGVSQVAVQSGISTLYLGGDPDYDRAADDIYFAAAFDNTMDGYGEPEAIFGHINSIYGSLT